MFLLFHSLCNFSFAVFSHCYFELNYFNHSKWWVVIFSFAIFCHIFVRAFGLKRRKHVQKQTNKHICIEASRLCILFPSIHFERKDTPRKYSVMFHQKGNLVEMEQFENNNRVSDWKHRFSIIFNRFLFIHFSRWEAFVYECDSKSYGLNYSVVMVVVIVSILSVSMNPNFVTKIDTVWLMNQIY